MSSRFVSGGTTEQPRERNELWQKAEQELEVARLRKEEQKNHDGKTLYEVLQENKAAKQEAFEEAAKLKHQFRSLDEDDVSFLNGIRESEAAKEREVQKQTLDQLEAFRKQQEVSAAATDSDPTADPDATLVENGITWTVPTKKRKRETVKGLKGVKSVKTAASTDEEVTEPKTEAVTSKKSDTKDGVETVAIDRVDVAQATKAGPKVMAPSALFVAASDNVGAPKAGPILGLGDYSSDED